MKRSIIYMLATAIISGSAIASIFVIATRIPDNGFDRRLIGLNLKFINAIDLKSTSIVFAGTAEIPIKLKNFGNPKEMIIVNPESGLFLKSVLKYPKTFELGSGYINIGTTSERTYITNGKTGDVFIANGQNRRLLYKVPNIRFDQSVAISDHSLIVRSKTTEPARYRELTKLTFKDNRITKQSIRLPKQIDGIFCTDGWLQYDPINASLIYAYYYRGQFLYLDTNLQLKYTAKTIDTVKMAKIKVGVVSSRLNDSTYFEQRTQLKPPPTINRHHTSFADQIYILSTLKADNESPSAFKDNQVIDVYSRDDGKYMHSFYIPKYKGNKLRQFRITNNRIYCIFSNYFVEFSFNAR